MWCVCVPLLECAASVDVGCIPLVVEFSKYSPYNSPAAARILTETAFICSFQSVYCEESLGICCDYTPTRSYVRFSARSNGVSQLMQLSNTHMPDGAGPHEAIGERVTELVISLTHGGPVTVQFNPYLVMSTKSFVAYCVLMHCGSAC